MSSSVPSATATRSDAPVSALGGPAVSLHDVTAGYDGQPALEDVDLEIAPGSLLAIFGPNGGGKTTMLKLIAGMLRAWSGIC